VVKPRKLVSTRSENSSRAEPPGFRGEAQPKRAVAGLRTARERLPGDQRRAGGQRSTWPGSRASPCFDTAPIRARAVRTAARRCARGATARRIRSRRQRSAVCSSQTLFTSSMPSFRRAGHAPTAVGFRPGRSVALARGQPRAYRVGRATSCICMIPPSTTARRSRPYRALKELRAHGVVSDRHRHETGGRCWPTPPATLIWISLRSPAAIPAWIGALLPVSQDRGIADPTP